MEKETKKKSVKKNFIYNLIYQVFLIIVPVVVTPYVSRVLQSDGVGQVSYSFSIVSYFTLLAALGFSYYAQREIAKCQNDKVQQSKVFWEICFVRLISTLISFASFVLITQFVPAFTDYRFYLMLLSINVLSVGIDTTFIFQGNEDFKQIAVRNFIAKALVISSIFIFVRKQEDLWIYVLIQALNPLVSALFMLPFLKRYLVKVPVKDLHPLHHLLPCLRLFIPTIAISVYTMLDKTMLGLMVKGTTTVVVNGEEVVKKISDIENGYYNQSEKIIKMLITVVTALGTVMIPRNAYFFANGREEEAKNNVLKGLRFAALLAFPMMLGVIAVADNFAPWFFGPGYEKVPLLMKVFSPLLVAIGFNNVFGIQYLIPSGKDNKFTISVTLGAVVNLIMNVFLIRYYASLGATIASVCAEFSILIIQMIMLRKEFHIWKALLSGWKYALSALVMFVPCYFTGKYLTPSILHTCLIVLVGMVTYLIMLLILKDEFLFSAIRGIKAKLSKKKAE